jgi:hypothetical protein
MVAAAATAEVYLWRALVVLVVMVVVVVGWRAIKVSQSIECSV